MIMSPIVVKCIYKKDNIRKCVLKNLRWNSEVLFIYLSYICPFYRQRILKETSRFQGIRMDTGTWGRPSNAKIRSVVMLIGNSACFYIFVATPTFWWNSKAKKMQSLSQVFTILLRQYPIVHWNTSSQDDKEILLTLAHRSANGN